MLKQTIVPLYYYLVFPCTNSFPLVGAVIGAQWKLNFSNDLLKMACTKKGTKEIARYHRTLVTEVAVKLMFALFMKGLQQYQ